MNTYLTAQGDTWDQMALKSYGSPYLIRDMLAENGRVDLRRLLVWRFGPGVKILVPDPSPSLSKVAERPAWRRGDD